MTPITNQFNNALFAINALRSFAQAGSSFSNPSIFGSYNFNTFSAFNSDLFSLASMAPVRFQMPTFNFSAFNFNMPAMQTAAVTAPSFNFGSFGTNVRATSPQQVRLTSNRVQNALSLAASQIGVREVGSTNNGAEVNKYRGGRADGQAWCASFVSWCYGQGQNGDNSKTFGYDSSTQSIRRKAERAGHYSTKESGYVPQVGDLAMWKYSESTGHVGIITKVYPDGSFDTIEGNCDNKVQRVHRSKSSDGFHGFVRMNEWIAESESQSRVA